jgi:uncharacterized protein YggU (UPF0235/DUF167 family)
MKVDIRVRPHTGGSKVGGIVGGTDEGALLVRVAMGGADEARWTEMALRAVASSFGVRRQDVTLVNGVGARVKTLNVGGAVDSDLARRHEQLLANLTPAG